MINSASGHAQAVQPVSVTLLSLPFHRKIRGSLVSVLILVIHILPYLHLHPALDLGLKPQGCKKLCTFSH